MKRAIIALAMLMIALASLGAQAGVFASMPPADLTSMSKIDKQVLKDTANGQSASFAILLTQQADLTPAYSMKDQDARGWFVYNSLRDTAASSQAPIRAALTSAHVPFQPYWAANMIVASGDLSLVQSLAARPDVKSIDSNDATKWIDDPVGPTPSSSSSSEAAPDTPNTPDTVEWNVQNVNAPQVWAQGYTGQGIVVASQDTGVRWTHAALKPQYRGWNGSSADHNYNWWDAIHDSVSNPCGNNSQQPCDDYFHGSHTTGSAVGSDGGANQIGVAPGAKWIACRNMDQGNGTPARYTECFQFMIAPTDLAGQNPNPALRPHVIINSWGCPTSEGCTTGAELETIVNNTQASGIFVEVSAGNSGSGCSSVDTPPALYSAAFSVGAIDISNTLAGFSSRGPSLYYTPNLLKPEISAPGVNVRSATNSGDTSYTTASGTSMAGPHIAGVVALIWSARPSLVRDITGTKQLLEQTANPNLIVNPVQTCGGIPSSQIPNNSFGYGRVDALAAFNASGGGTPTPTAQVPTNTPTLTHTNTPTPLPTNTPSPVCGLAWRTVSSPNQGTSDNHLLGVAVVNSNDIWAAGYYYIGGTYQTLTEHWNGSAWSVVPSPNQGSSLNVLDGVAVVGANDVWAVGSYLSGSIRQTLTEHWNGSAWSIAPSPNQGTGDNYLSGVAVVGANDIWAVGYYYIGSIYQTLTEHWNGSAWSIVSSPNQGSADYLSGVAAVITGDMWAVGSYSNGSFDQTLTEHWNGSAWSIVPSPNQGSGFNDLNGVAVVGASDVWAVGYYYNGTGQTLTEHWNGSAWTIVPSPNQGSSLNNLRNVAVVGANDVWAVGYYLPGAIYQTLTEHWDGSAWSIVSSPNQGTSHNDLYGVAVVNSSNVWAAGYYHSSVDQTLVVRYNDPCSTPPPTVTATATRTNTPPPANTNTPTRTPIHTLTPVPTNTPLPSQTPGGFTATSVPTNTRTRTPPPTDTPGLFTPTPTACPIQFSDVPAGSTFYVYIHCLACNGIISGYPDGTFKPGNNVTRGQLSKIVSNAAGFSDNQTTQMFQDVPVGSTFFQYIGRLASRGFINGYPCGIPPAGPCGPIGNTPYFLPNNNATRGQISKIVSNTAGFNETPSGQQFQDVTPNSTFYAYIYRLVLHGVMSGYTCGTPPAGQCVPPNNLPYFLPGNNATRGQTSKIVANTFFPECNPPDGATQ